MRCDPAKREDSFLGMNLDNVRRAPRKQDRLAQGDQNRSGGVARAEAYRGVSCSNEAQLVDVRHAHAPEVVDLSEWCLFHQDLGEC